MIEPGHHSPNLEPANIRKVLLRNSGILHYTALAHKLRAFEGHGAALQTMLRQMERDGDLHFLGGQRYGLPGYSLDRPDYRQSRHNSHRIFNENAAAAPDAASYRNPDTPPSKNRVGIIRQSADGIDILYLNRKSGHWPLQSADLAKVKPGDVVTFTVPSGSHSGEDGAVVTDVLGPEAQPEHMFNKISLYENGITREFNRAALAQANDPALLVVPKPDGKFLHDNRHLELAAIDPADACDRDDAIGAEHLTDGGYRIWIAIADVPRYVRPGSPLDLEARRRGNSTYVPGEVVPMLPESLSNGICSLHEGVDRAAFIFECQIDAEGEIVSQEPPRRAIIRVGAALSYDAVQGARDGGPPGRTAGFERLMDAVYGANAALAIAREKRDMLDLDTPTTRIGLDEDAETHTGADRMKPYLRQKFEANRVVENFMILGGIFVARALNQVGAPFIRREQPSPKEEKIAGLAERLDMFGIQVNGNPGERHVLKDVLRQATGHPLSRKISGTVLRSLERARFSASAGRHFSLGFDNEDYAQVTSPIRRAGDLTNLRLLIRYYNLGHDGATDQEIEELADSARHYSNTSRQSDAAESASCDRFAAHALSKRKSETLAGTISRIDRNGLFIQLDDNGVTGFLPLEALPADNYSCDERTGRLVGARHTFHDGDRMMVQVEEAEGLSGRITFRRAPDRALGTSPSAPNAI